MKCKRCGKAIKKNKKSIRVNKKNYCLNCFQKSFEKAMKEDLK